MKLITTSLTLKHFEEGALVHLPGFDLGRDFVRILDCAVGKGEALTLLQRELFEKGEGK